MLDPGMLMIQRNTEICREEVIMGFGDTRIPPQQTRFSEIHTGNDSSLVALNVAKSEIHRFLFIFLHHAIQNPANLARIAPLSPFSFLSRTELLESHRQVCPYLPPRPLVFENDNHLLPFR